MTYGAKAYISLILTTGTILCVCQLALLQPADLTRFFSYLAAILIAACLKVKLPGVNGTMSVYFVFLLIGLVQMSLPEVILLGLGAGTMQTLWQAKKRPTLLQFSFNLCAISLATAAADLIFHLPLFGRLHFSFAFEIAAAAMVFFAGNTALIAIVIALTEKRKGWRVWRECYFWCFPYYLVGASIACLFQVISHFAGWQAALLILPSAYAIYVSYRTYLGRLEDEKGHAEQVAALHLRTIEALALAIDAKDATTHEHLQRVQVYAMQIGRKLALTDDELRALQAASLLHDIGKLAVPEHIISKPGKLSPEEFDKMRIHPVVGAEILDRVQFPYPVAPIVRAHHEKWDGTGYPYGLKEEEIPIGARILSAVDCLDALASDRQYRRALPLDKALEIVVAESGKSYDPKVVEILRENYHEFESLATHGPKISELAKLSRDVTDSRGEAPAAGFERSTAPTSADFLQAIAKAREEAQGLFEMAQSLGNSLSLNDTFSMMASRLKRLVAYDTVAIYVFRDEHLQPEYVAGEDVRLFSSVQIPWGEGLCGWVAANNKPILNGNPAVEPGFLNVPAGKSHLKSAIAVPLETTSGVIGVLALYHTEREAFSRDQVRILQAVCSKLSVAIENALRFASAETSATTDYLTSLPNARSLFLHLDSEVGRASRDNTPLTVLVCDLDGFKSVNDRFGHLAGNKILAKVAQGLKGLCRPYDYAARMGGDEFVVVLPGMSADAAEEKVAAFNQLAREAGIEMCGESILGMSVGQACFPRDAEDAEGLLAEADRRMYKRKEMRKLTKSRTPQLDAPVLLPAAVQVPVLA